MIVENKIENFELRNWQDECVRKALKWYTSQSKYRQFVMNVAPASGKTKTACVIASELYKRNLLTELLL